jgi:aspartyl-tRNA(Asn)/glutamyl-tRNA(Gln) amidotransferase subunit A
MTIREIGALLRARKTSCVEFINHTFSEIETHDRFNSFITLTREQALAEAAQRDAELHAGVDRGPLHGVPIALKDIVHTAGIRTTGASRLFENFVPEHDAVVVTQLKSSGAISIGKTNLHELAYGATSQISHFGPMLNPHDSARIPGGSSGGSAVAVAAGWVPMALGSDTGGSIRIPASYCGVVGFKPTYERVSRKGVMPLAYGLDHVGPIGATVEDCVLTMQVIGGLEPADMKLSGLRVCLPANFFFERIDEEVDAAVKNSTRLLEREGAIVSEQRIPDLHQANLAARIIQASEATAVYAQCNDPGMFNSVVWGLLQEGRRVSGHEYVNAQRIRTLFRQSFNDLWKKYDVIVAPSTPIVAPLREETDVLIGGEKENARMASTRLARAVNFLGEPAISLPCGRTKLGLPIGLQLIARPGDDARLLAIAQEVEKLLAFAQNSQVVS